MIYIIFIYNYNYYYMKYRKKKTAILIINNGNPKNQIEFSEFFKSIFTSVNLPFNKSIGSWIASKYSKIFMLQDQNNSNNPKIINNLWASKQRKIFELYMNKISSLTGTYKKIFFDNNKYYYYKYNINKTMIYF